MADAEIAPELDALEWQRTSIASDLHDQLIPYLFVAKMRLESLLAQTNEVTIAVSALDDVRERLTKSVESLDEAMQVARGLMSELFTPELEAMSWEQQLRHYFSLTPTSAPSELEIIGDWDLCATAAATRIAGRRIAQEAIRNAIRHGKATKIEVVCQITTQGSELFIRDNGRGFESNQIIGGSGLKIMRYRAQQAGGELMIDSSAHGTLVQLKIVSGLGNGGQMLLK